MKEITTEGITTLAWEYGGRVHRQMRFTGVALVHSTTEWRGRMTSKTAANTTEARSLPLSEFCC